MTQNPLSGQVEESGMDPNTLSDVLKPLPEEDQKKMAVLIDRLQITDSLKLYNSIVEGCYSDCVESFWQKALTKHQAGCINKCGEKFMKIAMRVGLRYGELSQGKDISDASD